MNPIYLSTGAFTGRVNGRNLRLLSEYHSAFHCDGFEYMQFEDNYDAMPDMLRLYKGINIPVVHSDKTIGDYLSTDGEDAWREAKRRTEFNLWVCETVGAQKMVVHGWGKPDSDKNPERSMDRILQLWDMAKKRGIDLLCENCSCVVTDPLTMFSRMIERENGLHFIFDTRPAEFHRQVQETFHGKIFAEHAAHMHINDYIGGFKEWTALYPIPQPGTGQIDWNCVFSGLKACNYAGSLTLEAPSMLAEGVDADTLNRGLDFIRQGLS